MMAHLGMTGKFFIVKKNHIKERTSFYYRIYNDNNKHDRFLLVLNKGIKLIYNDVRKFGFIKILLKDTIDYKQHLRLLGPEPLGNFFNFKYFKDYLVGRKRTIKDLLMDQKFIAGLGNIYVNEILFLCKIKPVKNVNLLKDKEIRQIIRFTKSVLKKAIQSGGSSINNFSDTVGNKGNFQQLFNVYG